MGPGGPGVSSAAASGPGGCLNTPGQKTGRGSCSPQLPIAITLSQKWGSCGFGKGWEEKDSIFQNPDSFLLLSDLSPLFHLSASGRSFLFVLYCARLGMKCFLGISNFLEHISRFSFLPPPRPICTDHLGSLFTSPCYSWEFCIQMDRSFLLSFAFHVSSFLRYL